ncbi:MAG: hypothetical protein QXX51_08970 [Candidatus Bathyarchaeia archaeon]
MQIRIKRFTFSVAAALLILGLSVSLLSIQKREEPSDIPMLTLVKPALAQTSGSSTTFLDEEAGIALYTDVKQTIDLAKAKNVYRTVEKETLDYVVGSVALPNLQTSDDAHCFIHRNGWIVIYYLKGEPASKILDWRYYSGGKLSKNKLQLGLEKVCSTLGITASEVGYYHFQYPQANRLLIIIGSQTGSGEHVFYYQIPSSLDVFEGSWSHYASSKDKEYIGYGKLTQPMLGYETRHTVKIKIVYGWDYYSRFYVDEVELSYSGYIYDINVSYGAIFLVYKEP